MPILVKGSRRDGRVLLLGRRLRASRANPQIRNLLPQPGLWLMDLRNPGLQRRSNREINYRMRLASGRWFYRTEYLWWRAPILVFAGHIRA